MNSEKSSKKYAQVSLDVAIGVASVLSEAGEIEPAARWLSYIGHHDGASPDSKARAKECFVKLSSGTPQDLLDRAWAQGASMSQEEFEVEIIEYLSVEPS